MEIKKIISFCKKSGVLQLFEGAGAQWISDGAAMYPLINLPIFDEESICRTYDIPESKASKMRIQCEMRPPSAYDLADTTPDETACKREDPLFGGIVPLTTSQGMMFTDGKYLTPFKGTSDDMIYVYERHTAAGDTYFAIKVGFELSAIVLPYDCVNESLVSRLKNVYEQCEIALFNKNGGGAK